MRRLESAAQHTQSLGRVPLASVVPRIGENQTMAVDGPALVDREAYRQSLPDDFDL
jgi:hypothetical protein